jgi:hypothetical protein
MRLKPPRCGTRRTVRSATLACLLALLPGCHEEATSPSPTLTLSRSPDGLAIAGVTAVVLTADASVAGGDALAVSWDFGDGQVGSGASVTHVYAREGVYAVSVTAKASGGGVTTTGTSVTVGGLDGRWLLSGGGEFFYETGFDVTQVGSTLGGRPYSVPDKGCLGELHGLATTPRSVRFVFRSCDDEDVIIEGAASGDLRSILGTFTHPEVGTVPIVLSRQ